MKSSTDRASLGCAILLALVAALSLALICAGCKNPNTGSSIVVGDVTSLPEITDAADNISIKVLLMMTGAKVWTAKDSLVKVGYANCYTNWYCGIIERRGAQSLTVEVEPLEVGGEVAPCETAATTNAVEETTPTITIEEMKRLTGQDGSKRNAVAVGSEITAP